MSSVRKKQIAREFNAKDFLSDARDIISSVYPESGLKKKKFKHAQVNKSVEKTLDSIKERCFEYKMESIGWNAWDDAEYKGVNLSVNANVESSPSERESIRKALNK